MDVSTLLDKTHSLLTLILGGGFAGKTAELQKKATDLSKWIRENSRDRPPLEAVTSKADLKELAVQDLDFLTYQQPASYYCGKLGVMTPLEMREFILANLCNLEIAKQVHAYIRTHGRTVFEDAEAYRMQQGRANA